MVGRKTSLTPEVHKRLIEVLSIGAPIADACAYVGVTERSFYNWIKRGERAKDGVFFQFFQDVTRARVSARVGAIGIIRKSISDGNPQSAQWFLERSDPANWGRKDKLILDVDPALLRQLQTRANAVGVNLSDVFEAMIQELANVDSAENRAEFVEPRHDQDI